MVVFVVVGAVVVAAVVITAEWVYSLCYHSVYLDQHFGKRCGDVEFLCSRMGVGECCRRLGFIGVYTSP